MIIKEIYIDGFGIFDEFKLQTLSRGINIIEGENETGKSTFLNFIRYTLFGYPNKISDRHEPLNGSARHGGRIVVQLNNGKEATFERYAGTRGGKTQLYYDGGVTSNPSDWSALLGNAHSQLFDNIYGFTLYELIDFENLKGSGIEDKIFSLGIGLTNVTIGNVQKNLVEKAESIYKKSGSKHLISQVLKAIDEKKLSIQTIQNGLHQYELMITRVENINETIIDLENELEQAKTTKELLTNYIKSYDSYFSVLQIDRDLQGLPAEFNCPQDGEQLLKNLENQENTLKDSINEILVNENDDSLTRIENDLRNLFIDETIFVEEESINRLNEQLERYRTDINENLNSQKEIEDLNSAIQQNINKINGDWNEDNISAFSNLVVHRDAINQFDSANKDLLQQKLTLTAKQQAKKEQASGSNKTSLYTLGIIAFIVLALPAFYYSIPFGIAFISIAVLIAVFLFVSKKADKDNFGNDLAAVQNRLDELTRSYNSYLHVNLNLPPNLSHAAVVEIFNLVDTAKVYIQKRDAVAKRIKERNQFIELFEKSTRELRDILNLEPATDSSELIIQNAKNRLNNAKEILLKKQNLERMLEVKQKELGRLEKAMESVRQQINQLLVGSNAKDRNDFLQKYYSEKKAKQFIEERKAHLNTIERIIGFEKTKELWAFMEGKDQLLLQNQLQEIEATIREKTQVHSQLKEEKGGLETELKNLKSHSTLSGVETELEVERTKLSDYYKQWLTSKVALKVLLDVKTKFEQDKQPEVIKYSSEVFSNITSGRYKRIHVPIDSPDILVFDHLERAKKINQLSRGTREQLLISLRLGLIQEYEKNKEPLPIVLDDVFVNFDSCRTKNIADALQKFAENRQVIIFTCHPYFADNFSQHVNKLKMPSFASAEEKIPGDLLSQKIEVN